MGVKSIPKGQKRQYGANLNATQGNEGKGQKATFLYRQIRATNRERTERTEQRADIQKHNHIQHRECNIYAFVYLFSFCLGKIPGRKLTG